MSYHQLSGKSCSLPKHIAYSSKNLLEHTPAGYFYKIDLNHLVNSKSVPLTVKVHQEYGYQDKGELSVCIVWNPLIARRLPVLAASLGFTDSTYLSFNRRNSLTFFCMTPLDSFYHDQEEPVKGCLLALKSIIEEYNPAFEHRWYYRLPCFMYQNQIFCYLWIDKKRQHPYIAVGKGVKIEHPGLVQGNRTFTKLLMIDPEKDIPLETVYEVFDLAMELYPKS